MSTEDGSDVIPLLPLEAPPTTVQVEEGTIDEGSVSSNVQTSETRLSGIQLQPEDGARQAYLNLGLGPNVNAQAYIQENRLCILGVCQTHKHGPIPFSYSCMIEDEMLTDGPLSLESNQFSPGVEKALSISQQAVSRSITLEKMKRATQALVERARLGDQVAMATILEVGNAARKGGERAKAAYRMLKQYIDTHPAHENTFGEEIVLAQQNRALVHTLSSAIEQSTPVQYVSAVMALVPSVGFDSLDKASVTLANGPDISSSESEYLTAVNESFPEEERKAFQFGLKNSSNLSKILAVAQKANDKENKALQIGYSMGVARRIQAVRHDNAPISVLSGMAAWELGE